MHLLLSKRRVILIIKSQPFGIIVLFFSLLLMDTAHLNGMNGESGAKYHTVVLVKNRQGDSDVTSPNLSPLVGPVQNSPSNALDTSELEGGMQSLHLDDGGDGEKVNLRGGTSFKEHPLCNVKDCASFEAMQLLLERIANAEVDVIEACAEVKKLEAIVHGFQENRSRLTDKKQVASLQKLFDALPSLCKTESYSPLWLAVEYALQSKASNELKQKYVKRLKIVELLARVTQDKFEQHVFSRNCPAWWSIFCCACCCGPCISIRDTITEGLLYRAVQQNDQKVISILKRHGFTFQKNCCECC